MFDIFHKKQFLVDALSGFVDIHNHILPGIDDGAKTADESIALIREFGTFGVTNFIATPHIMKEYYPNTPETINEAYKILKGRLIEEDLIQVAIEAAAEHMIDLHYEADLEAGHVQPMRSQHLLVEMSYLQPSLNFEQAIIKSMRAGYFCILAHPERYAYLHKQKKKYNDYKALGVLFQLNLLSLGGYYGKQVSKMAYELLDRNMIDFVGTDVHKLKHLQALKEIRLSSNQLQKVTSLVRNNIKTFY